MCRTFNITYDRCLHIKTKRKNCPESRSILAIFRLDCERAKTEAHNGDFCEDCRLFFDSHGVSTEARGELVHSYRVAHTYYKALTPMVGRKDGELTFRMDTVSERRFAVLTDRQDDDTIQLSMLEAPSWVLQDDEMPAPAAPRARRDSTSSFSSTNTIWPSATDDTPAEQDEFGHAIDLESISAANFAHLALNSITDHNEFELSDLGEQLSGSFEIGTLRPIGPLPTALPYRPTAGRRLA